MSQKYGGYGMDKRNPEKVGQKIHPVWRGVGFAFIVLIPIMAYASMKVLLEQNDIHGWIALTPDMMAKQGEFLYTFFPDPMLYIKIVLFLLFLFVFFIVFQLFSFLITGMSGVSTRNDPFYVPPVRRSKRPPSKIYRRR